MTRNKSRWWLVVEPAVGIAVAGFIAYQWTRGAVAHVWSKL